MPSSYTTSLRLTLPATGELSGQWGNTVNTGITELLDSAVAGTASISTWGGAGVAYTLSSTSGAADEARKMFIVASGSPGEAKNVICPAVSKFYVFRNDTTGGFALTLKTPSGTGISVPAGQYKFLYCDGTNVVEMFNSAGVLSLSGNLTLSGGTANGVLYLNGSKVATSGTALAFNGTQLAVNGSDPTVGGGQMVVASANANGIVVNNTVAGQSSTLYLRDVVGSNPQRIKFMNAPGLAFVDNNDSEFMRLTSTGLGIGTSSPGTRLHLKGATNQVSIKLENPQSRTFQILSNGSTGGGGAPTGSFAIYDETAGADRLTLDSSGNLGLGVTPSASNIKTLEINNAGNTVSSSGQSQLLLSANAYYNSGWKYGGTGSPVSQIELANGAFIFNNAPSGTAGNAISFTQAMTLDASGNLGVGTTSPTFVNGAGGLQVSRATSPAIRLNTPTASFEAVCDASASYLFATSNTPLVFGTNNTERARITSGGQLLIATTNASVTAGSGFKFLPADGGTDIPRLAIVTAGSNGSNVPISIYSTAATANRFYVNDAGTIFATSTTITAISDQRLKENIRDLDAGLSEVMALKPRKFDWKAGKGKDKKDDRGWIAQEFEQVFPDMVDTWLDPAPEGEEPYKAVNADLIPVLVKAIQEQQALITALTARVQVLEAKP